MEDEEGEDNFASAFAEFASSDKPAEQPAEAAAEPEADAAGADAPADQPAGEPAPQDPAPSDPWANASPEQIAARDALIEERDRFRHSDQSQRGRIGALQRKVTELSSSQPHTPQDKEEDEGKAQKLRDQINQIKEDYPDLGGPILAIIEGLTAKVDALAPTVATIEQDRSAAATQAELAVLTGKHADWQDFAYDTNADGEYILKGKSAKDFVGWLIDQPITVQQQANSSDAREVSAALSLFKTERGIAMGTGGITPKVESKPDARRSKQLDGNRAVSSRSVPAASGSPDDFEGAFAHFANKRKRA